MRPNRLSITVAAALVAVGVIVPTPSPASAACTLATPVAVGSIDGLTVRVKRCTSGEGGYVTVYGVQGDFVTSKNVPLGSNVVRFSGLNPYRSYRFRYFEGPASGSPTSTYATRPFLRTAAAVDRSYHELLDVNPTTSMRNTATDLILHQNLITFLQDLERDAYWQQQYPITRLYLAFHQRAPDYGGLMYWTGRHQRGASMARIGDAFASSSEFTRTYGNLTNGQFVRTVYRNVLRREADAKGERFWTNQLDRRLRTRGGVMAAFSDSSENVRRTARVVRAVSWMSALWGTVPSTKEVDRFAFDHGDSEFGSAEAAFFDLRYDRHVGTAGPPVVWNASLPGALEGKAYATKVRLYEWTGGGSIRWTAGGLPSGLTMSSSGTISGTPAEAGTFAVTLHATDGAGAADTRTVSLVVDPS